MVKGAVRMMMAMKVECVPLGPDSFGIGLFDERPLGEKHVHRAIMNVGFASGDYVTGGVEDRLAFWGGIAHGYLPHLHCHTTRFTVHGKRSTVAGVILSAVVKSREWEIIFILARIG